jgi:hypothetical protein
MRVDGGGECRPRSEDPGNNIANMGTAGSSAPARTKRTSTITGVRTIAATIESPVFHPFCFGAAGTSNARVTLSETTGQAFRARSRTGSECISCGCHCAPPAMRRTIRTDREAERGGSKRKSMSRCRYLISL